MTDAQIAQKKIDAMPKMVFPTKEEWDLVSHLKVDYTSILDMPIYKQERLNECIKHIVKTYKPNHIYLVMSQLNGYPVDEFTSSKDFQLLRAIKKTKISDWDFIVDTIPDFQKIDWISPMIKIDMFKVHHGNVKKLLIYEHNK